MLRVRYDAGEILIPRHVILPGVVDQERYSECVCGDANSLIEKHC